MPLLYGLIAFALVLVFAGVLAGRARPQKAQQDIALLEGEEVLTELPSVTVSYDSGHRDSGGTQPRSHVQITNLRMLVTVKPLFGPAALTAVVARDEKHLASTTSETRSWGNFALRSVTEENDKWCLDVSPTRELEMAPMRFVERIFVYTADAEAFSDWLV